MLGVQGSALPRKQCSRRGMSFCELLYTLLGRWGDRLKWHLINECLVAGGNHYSRVRHWHYVSPTLLFSISHTDLSSQTQPHTSSQSRIPLSIQPDVIFSSYPYVLVTFQPLVRASSPPFMPPCCILLSGVLPTGRNIHALDPYRMPSAGKTPGHGCACVRVCVCVCACVYVSVSW